MNHISHYEHFPCMKPWVGDKYYSSLQKRLLVIGESHYFPKDSVIQLNPDEWYKATQSDLSELEIKWISTSKIIENNKNVSFPKKGHGIYRNLAKAINLHSFKYAVAAQVLDHIAYYNYFQRPAENSGDSVSVSRIDVEVAQMVLEAILKELKPQLIIFVSSLAARSGQEVVEKSGLPFIVTPHPTSAWWNRESKKYRGRGRDLIPRFLRKHEWLA